jgi:hypothetical protein
VLPTGLSCYFLPVSLNHPSFIWFSRDRQAKVQVIVLVNSSEASMAWKVTNELELLAYLLEPSALLVVSPSYSLLLFLYYVRVMRSHVSASFVMFWLHLQSLHGLSSITVSELVGQHAAAHPQLQALLAQSASDAAEVILSATNSLFLS